jgi:virulence-associated protein VagC
MTTEGGELIIAPVRKPKRDRVKVAIDRAMREHAESLRKLAR